MPLLRALRDLAIRGRITLAGQGARRDPDTRRGQGARRRRPRHGEGRRSRRPRVAVARHCRRPRRIRPQPARELGPAGARRGPHQPRDRRAAVHQRADRRRPRAAHPGEARRWRAHRGSRHGHSARPGARRSTRTRRSRASATPRSERLRRRSVYTAVAPIGKNSGHAQTSSPFFARAAAALFAVRRDRGLRPSAGRPAGPTRLSALRRCRPHRRHPAATPAGSPAGSPSGPVLERRTTDDNRSAFVPNTPRRAGQYRRHCPLQQRQRARRTTSSSSTDPTSNAPSLGATRDRDRARTRSSR